MPAYTMKRFLFVCLCISGLFVFCLGASAHVAGDADGDGLVLAADARLVLRASVELETFTGESFCALDTDGDDVLTAKDARSVLRASVELETLPETQKNTALTARKDPVVSLNGAYYTYNDLCRDLETLQTLAPSRFSYTSLGQTADGREIWCAVLGTGKAKNRILADVAIHGSEHRNTPAVMRIIEEYLRNYDRAFYKGKTVREILDDTDLYILPMLNPDGAAISQTGLEGLNKQSCKDRVQAIYRSNRSAGRTGMSFAQYLNEWKANVNGVDLNRNLQFSDKRFLYETNVPAPAARDYAGDRANPEAETAAYRKLAESLPDLAASLSIHTQGELIYWDCRQPEKGRAAAKRLANTVSAASGYRLDMSDSFVGAVADWMMIEKGIPAVTVECGKGRNPIAADETPKIYEALKTVFLAVVLENTNTPYAG